MLTLKKQQLFALGLSFLLMAQLHAATDNAALTVNWGYRGNIGPQFWGQLAPSFAACAEGRSQSPINILSTGIQSADHQLRISYVPANLIEAVNGYIPLVLGTQTIMSKDHGVQVDFDDHAHETIQFAGESYHLIQFHFHSPSETEWHGQSYPLEIHFVHQGEHGKVAVVAVFVKGGQENAALQKMLDHMPPADGKVYPIKDEKINPADLIPANRSYYSFMGSLTTPPCSEGLQWIVLPDTITASPAQILKLRAAAGGENARPEQPLHHRSVFYAKEK